MLNMKKEIVLSITVLHVNVEFLLLKTYVDIFALDSITGPSRVPVIFEPSLVFPSSETIGRSAATSNGCHQAVPQPSICSIPCPAGSTMEVLLNCEQRESADD